MTPELATTLSNLGAGALLIFVIGLLAIGLLAKKWVVPGWVLQAEVERRMKLEAQLERVTILLENAYRRGARRYPDATDDPH